MMALLISKEKGYTLLYPYYDSLTNPARSFEFDLFDIVCASTQKGESIILVKKFKRLPIYELFSDGLSMFLQSYAWLIV